MTETTKETIKFARSWLGNAEKYGNPNAPTTGTMTALARAVMELADEVEKLESINMDHLEELDRQEWLLDNANEELAALKEKTRWHKYQDEPLSSVSGYVLLYYKAYDGEEIFVMGDAREVEEQYAGVWGITPDRQVYKLNILWRPLDLPEESK